MIYFQSLSRADVAQLLAEAFPAETQIHPKRPAMRAKQIFHWVYQRHVLDWAQMSDLSRDIREWLAAHVEIYRLEKKVSQTSLDGTQKFLWNLHDQKTIESVVIPAALQSTGEHARLTACISSQVGCAMACKFCVTGLQGIDRNLQTHEIVTQVHELRMLAPITNVVFMGMGEPLNNLDAVAKACEILIDGDGLQFSKRRVTVSTSGVVPAIDELGKRVDVSLAISLNASHNDQRSEIMPVNRRWPLEELLAALRRYPLGSHRSITIEYVMLKDFNDTLADADRVVKLLHGLRCKVNLIPFNEHTGTDLRRPADDVVKRFQKRLTDRGVTTTVRTSRGRDILAACGQLKSAFGTARKSVSVEPRLEFASHPSMR